MASARLSRPIGVLTAPGGSGAPVTAMRVLCAGRGVLAKAALKTTPRARRNTDRLLHESALLIERSVRMIRDGLDRPLALRVKLPPQKQSLMQRLGLKSLLRR